MSIDRLIVVLAVVGIVCVLALGLRRRPESLLPGRLDVSSLGLGLGGVQGRAVVAFTAPLCLDCQRWLEALRLAAVPTHQVDLSRRGDVARRLGIAAAPVIAVLDVANGAVLASASGTPRDADVARLVAAARAA